MRAIYLLLLLVVVVFTLACTRSSPKKSDPAVEPYSKAEGSVGFDFRLADDSAQRLMCSYTVGGETARFGIEFAPPKPVNQKDFEMSFGSGKFLAVPGSNAESFLAELAKALEAKKIPQNVKRVSVLPFEYVILGENQTRSRDGGFGDSPRGHWTAMKIFLGGDEGEVFLNYDPVIGKAEFSIKDADYGDYLIAELAKVL